MQCYNRIFQILGLFGFVLLYAQPYKNDSLRAEFIYKLSAKLDTRSTSQYVELFTLKVGEERAFFASNESLKKDSVMNVSLRVIARENGTTLSYKGVSMPETYFHYTIIQTSANVQYFESAGMALLTYKEPILNNWVLLDESKVINTFSCRKATVVYKGRRWVAWYTTDLPFQFGPYKFAGLPGLIVKITDDKGDYDFELVQSTSSFNLKGRNVDIKKSRYYGAVETSQKKLEKALIDSESNASAILGSYNTVIVSGKEMLRQREKILEENRKYGNPIELLE